jgi:hypothetical protein
MLLRFFHFCSSVVLICSVAHTFLPPWDFLSDFPRAQKVYKAFIYVIGYVAINARSSVYSSLSTENGSKVSEAAAAVQISAKAP